MPFSETIRTIRLAMKSLLLHKLRSGLTMLGIVFGVFSVIAMLATVSLGGIWTSASPDFGVQGVLDRFGSSCTQRRPFDNHVGKRCLD